MSMFDYEWWRAADKTLIEVTKTGTVDWFIVGILLVVLFGVLYSVVKSNGRARR